MNITIFLVIVLALLDLLIYNQLFIEEKFYEENSAGYKERKSRAQRFERFRKEALRKINQSLRGV